MLRCRRISSAFRSLSRIPDSTARQGWQRVSTNGTAVREVRGDGPSRHMYTHRSRSTAHKTREDVDKGGGGGLERKNRIATGRGGAAPGISTHATKLIGGKGAELRAWQQAMLELARRHSVWQANGNNSKDPNKVSQSTMEYIPEVIEAWRQVIDGGGNKNLWFRGAAKFYASLLVGLWPKMANFFLADIIRACHGGSDGAVLQAGCEASLPSFSLRSLAMARDPTFLPTEPGALSSESAAAAVAATEADTARVGVNNKVGVGVGTNPPPDGLLDWRQGLEILKEARLAGVEIHPDLMVLALSKAPMGSSRKISFLVSDRGLKMYGFRAATPDMLATAAVLHWKEGVVVGAARHLDSMNRMNERNIKVSFAQTKSLLSSGPLVQEWLAADAQIVRSTNTAASPSGQHLVRQWPWRLVVVDIYGRASRWAKAAEAFDTFVGEMTFPSVSCASRVTGGGSSHSDEEGVETGGQEAEARARPVGFVRLPMPEEFELVGGGPDSRGSSVLPPAAWACFHPSPLMHAITAYLKHERVEEAAEVLSFLKASVGIGAASVGSAGEPDIAERSRRPSRHGGGGGGSGGPTVVPEDDQRRGILISPDLRGVSQPDVAWVEGTIRSFTRAGRWDLARDVLCDEILNWLTSETEAGEKQPDGYGDRDGGDGGLKPVVEPLETVPEPKPVINLSEVTPEPGVNRTAPEQTAGSCVEGSRGSGTGVTGEEKKPEFSVQMVKGGAPSASARGRDQHGATGGGDLVHEPKSASGRPVNDDQRGQGVSAYTEALRWLLPGGMVGPETEATVAETETVSSSSRWQSARESLGEDTDSRSVLLSRCQSVSEEAVMNAICRAWPPDARHEPNPEKGGLSSDATMKLRRSAAFALYEAGVKSETLPADACWLSQSAGVLNLDCRGDQTRYGVHLAALDLALNDMRRKYAYEEFVGRHVHQPYADLIMVVSIKAARRAIALETVKDVLWLLGNRRFGDSLQDGLELIGPANASCGGASAAGVAASYARNVTTAAKPKQRGTAKAAPEKLLDAVEQLVAWSPGRGVVLSLPRRALQGWLLAEGRARIERQVGGEGGDGTGGLWSPSWVEDGIDEVPPGLPGLKGVDNKGAGGGSKRAPSVGGGTEELSSPSCVQAR